MPFVARTPHSPRYLRPNGGRKELLDGRGQLSGGCQVHVGVASEDEGVAVLDRVRPWLAPLLALSASSPFWQGRDAGYASYRQQVWGRWPSAGSTELFGSAEAYHDTVRTML